MQTIVPFFYIPMHDVVPNVVAMAVRMVMAMCRIFCQMVWLFMVFLCFELLVFVFVFLHHRFFASLKELHRLTRIKYYSIRMVN